MYKILKISGKDYKIEYSIEASLYGDCIDKLMSFLTNMNGGAGIGEISKVSTPEQKMLFESVVAKNAIKGLSNIPSTVLSVFYAGLMKHHGRRGDQTIMSLEDAQDLILELFDEQEGIEDGIQDFYGLLGILIEQMEKDGFFKRIGLENIAKKAVAAKAQSAPNRETRRAEAKKASKSKS